MIEILRSKKEIDDAVRFLKSKNLPVHRDRLKNWDLSKLYQILEGRHRNAPILDVGCWMLATLKMLRAMGFRRMFGIDRYDDVSKFTQDKKQNFARILRGRFEDNSFRDKMFRFVTCVSVIEHGIAVNQFFKICERLIKREGLLFITTDYWSKKINTTELNGLPWTIFDRNELKEMVTIANQSGFTLLSNKEIPRVGRPIVSVNDLNYTFAMLVFVKN
jgi:2-polyprenyl-3-methyl-5-hydroxy-6-metoxy-1,4-benzoquinol methylase